MASVYDESAPPKIPNLDVAQLKFLLGQSSTATDEVKSQFLAALANEGEWRGGLAR